MILQTEVSVGLPSMLPSEAMVAAACDGNIQAMQTMVTEHGPDILTRTTIEGCTCLKESEETTLTPNPCPNPFVPFTAVLDSRFQGPQR